MNDNPASPANPIVSFQLDGALAEEVDRIAQEDGCSRSDVLRRLVLVNLESEAVVTVRWIRRLRVIEGQLMDLSADFEQAEASEAAEALEDAVGAVVLAIDELEDFEPEDD